MSQQPHPQGVRLLPWRIPTWLTDGFLVALILVGLLGADHALEWVATAVAIAVVLGRRRWPIPALAIAVVMTAIVVEVVEEPSMIMVAMLVALFHVALVYPWRTAVLVGFATTLVFGAVVFGRLEQGEEREEAGLAALAWPAFATAAGAAVRAGRLNLAAAQDRAARAEATREIEASRRVSEERLRIARDVHDLVAHHIAVVNVQSGVASHVLRSDPDAAEEALDNVRVAASTAVDELGQLLGVLRSADEAGAPLDPTPDLEATDELISSFTASGMRIERHTSGAPRPLTPSGQAAAYRVIQEALTNAHKHGDGTATISQQFNGDALELTVTNPSRPGRPSGSGYGLVGMRERLEAVEGELSTEEVDGRFTLRAVIPTTRPE